MKLYTFHWMSGASTTVKASNEWDAFNAACSAYTQRVTPFREMVVAPIPVDWAKVGPELTSVLKDMLATHRSGTEGSGWLGVREAAISILREAEDLQ